MDSLIFALITTFLAGTSVAFCLLSIIRLRGYIQAYRFDKNQYRPLLGFIHLRMMMWTYMASTLLLAGFLIIYIIYLRI